MIRLLLLIICTGAGFGGGFVAGIKYRNHQLVENPEEFLKTYGEAAATKAGKKYEKVKKALLEKD